MLHQEIVAGLTVSYDPNGGDGGIITVSVNIGEPYGPQPDAARRGYAFDGWFTAPTGGTGVTGDTIVTETKPHTLYAHWRSKPTCTVTFDPNGGRIKSAQSKAEYSDGDLYGELPVPIRDGYDFDGWFTQVEGGGQLLPETTFAGEDDRTVYAHWTYNPYEYWSFILKNTVQRMYSCQQAAVYFETETDHVTQISCPLITSTGSYNVAENRDDPNVTDDWVIAKNPSFIIKVAGFMTEADTAYRAVSSRFAGRTIVILSDSAVNGSDAEILFGRLALAKLLYGDWYADVDLAVVAEELGVGMDVIYTG